MEAQENFSLIRILFAHRANGKFLLCPFVDEETDGSYPFANGVKGLNVLAHLWAMAIE
jgi:hypothetical protein